MPAMSGEPFDTEPRLTWAGFIRALRDICATVCGVFLIVYGAMTVREPTLAAVFFGAGTAFLLGPPAIRLDKRREEES